MENLLFMHTEELLKKKILLKKEISKKGKNKSRGGERNFTLKCKVINSLHNFKFLNRVTKLFYY